LPSAATKYLLQGDKSMQEKIFLFGEYKNYVYLLIIGLYIAITVLPYFY